MTKRSFFAHGVRLRSADEPGLSLVYSSGTPARSFQANDVQFSATVVRTTGWFVASRFRINSTKTVDRVRVWVTPSRFRMGRLELADFFSGKLSWRIYRHQDGAKGGSPGSVLFSGTVTGSNIVVVSSDEAEADGRLPVFQMDLLIPSTILDSGTYWLGIKEGDVSSSSSSLRDLPVFWAPSSMTLTSFSGDPDVTRYGIPEAWRDSVFTQRAFHLYETVRPEAADLSVGPLQVEVITRTPLKFKLSVPIKNIGRAATRGAVVKLMVVDTFSAGRFDPAGRMAASRRLPAQRMDQVETFTVTLTHVGRTADQIARMYSRLWVVLEPPDLRAGREFHDANDANHAPVELTGTEFVRRLGL